MARAIVSVRGYVKAPCLVEVDLEKYTLLRVLEFDELKFDHVPLSKRGFSGIHYSNGYLYAATWDRVCILDPKKGKVLDVITDRRFSDLHGIHVDEEGIIWVASTNLDGIYLIKNREVEPFWHAWENQKLSGAMRLRDDIDYRYVEKEESPFHRFHINSVYPDRENVFVSCLGGRPKF